MRTKILSILVVAVVATVLCFGAKLIHAAKVSGITGTLLEYGYTPVKLKRAQNAVYADCTLNGRRVDLVVDTGASGTLIGAVKLGALGGSTKKVEGNFYGMLGQVAKSIEATEISDFQVGAYKAGAHAVGLWDFSRHRRPFGGSSTEGLLGIDFLHRHQAVLDCFQMNLFLKSPNAPSSSSALRAGLRAGGCTEVPLQVVGGVLAVPVRIQGTAGYLIVDTGSPWTLLSESAVAPLNLRRAAINLTLRGGFAYRTAISDVKGRDMTPLGMAYFKEMSIGDFKVPAQGVGVAHISPVGGGPGVFFGYLGQDLLAYYVGIIDCKALKLYLRLDPAVEAERLKHHT